MTRIVSLLVLIAAPVVSSTAQPAEPDSAAGEFANSGTIVTFASWEGHHVVNVGFEPVFDVAEAKRFILTIREVLDERAR